MVCQMVGVTLNHTIKVSYDVARLMELPFSNEKTLLQSLSGSPKVECHFQIYNLHGPPTVGKLE